jgi:PKD repeat protein
MKKIFTLLALLLLSATVQAQNCFFTWQVQQPNVVQFNANAFYQLPQFVVSWDFGDGTSIFAKNPVHTYQASGAYNVTMSVFDSLSQQNVCITTNTINLSFCDYSFNEVQGATGLFNFSCTSSAPNAVVSWDFGDGTALQFGNPINHTYAQPGAYIVTMSQLDSTGSTTICSRDFTVSYDTTGNCAYQTLQPNPTGSPGLFILTALLSNSNAQVEWNLGNGTAPVYGPVVQVAYGNPGTYNVCMTIYGAQDTCTWCDSLTVAGGGSNNCTFTLVPDSSNPLQYTFIGVPGTPGNTIVWLFGDGNTGSGPMVTHTYAVPNTYNVCMQELDSNGTIVCTICYNLTVQGANPCSFSFSPDSGNAYLFSFTTLQNPAYTYTWDFGDGSGITGSSVTHQYLQNGVYNVCLTVTDQIGNVVCNTCQNVIVFPPFCNAAYQAVSVGLTAYFVNMSVPANGASALYQWTFGDGTSSMLPFPNHNYAAPGTYNVCLTINSGGCTDTYCSFVQVDTTGNPLQGCDANFVFTQLGPYQMVAVNLSSGTNLNFAWDFGDGSPIVNGPYPTHQYASTGSYVVCLTVSDFFGCVDTHCDTLTVDSAGNIVYRGIAAGFVLNVLSPVQITSGIDEAKSDFISGLYPVPAREELFVQWSSTPAAGLRYQVISSDGREMESGTINAQQNRISTSALSSGLYLLRLQDDDGRVQTRTFMRQ